MEIDEPCDVADPGSEANWSATGSSQEHSPRVSLSSQEHDPEGGPWNMDGDDPNPKYHALSYSELVGFLDRQVLPSDDLERHLFDIRARFELGDPGVHFHAPAAKGYETSGEVGCPHWPALFACILQRCRGLTGIDTIFVLVDDRNLTSEVTTEESLTHWPTVAAWWKSRVTLTGPAQEKCDLVFFPISSESGLKHIHPTWAGTFVLAALCLVFPNKHFVLIDHDCIPVTLFEVRDLWREAHLAKVSGLPCGDAGVCTGYPSHEKPLVDFDSVPELGQGLLLVTEHNAEINAGFIVLFGSDHSPIVTEEDWRSIPVAQGEDYNRVINRLQHKVEEAYWQLVQKMVSNGRNFHHMTREECQAWVQTGLALTPFCGHHMDSSLELAVAWSLIGEWSCRELFLPPRVHGQGTATLASCVCHLISALSLYTLGPGPASNKALCLTFSPWQGCHASAPR